MLAPVKSNRSTTALEFGILIAAGVAAFGTLKVSLDLPDLIISLANKRNVAEALLSMALATGISAIGFKATDALSKKAITVVSKKNIMKNVIAPLIGEVLISKYFDIKLPIARNSDLPDIPIFVLPILSLTFIFASLFDNRNKNTEQQYTTRHTVPLYKI